MKIGYVRISSKTQNTDRQINKLLEIGIDLKNISQEDISAKTEIEDRKIWELVLKSEIGDEIYITSLDRMSRSVYQTLKILELVSKKGIKIISLYENTILEKDMDIQKKMSLILSSSFAEMELYYKDDRTKQGRENQKKKNIKSGRKQGVKQGSKLDIYEEEIIFYYGQGKKPQLISELLHSRIEVKRITVHRFIENLKKEGKI
jgi:DNA invertase Pin-like site-specific DNA recombinase